VPTHDALELTNGGKVATITLAGKHYTLRITKVIKLILTK
jgi:hemin uptake protein HemP